MGKQLGEKGRQVRPLLAEFTGILSVKPGRAGGGLGE